MQLFFEEVHTVIKTFWQHYINNLKV